MSAGGVLLPGAVESAGRRPVGLHRRGIFMSMSTVRLAPALALTLILAACGGSEVETPPEPPRAVDPQGMWDGSTSLGTDLEAIVTSNGEFWGIYSEVGADTAGLLHSPRLTMTGNTFKAEIDDYQYGNTVTRLTATGTVVPEVSLEARMTQGGRAATASLRYNSSYYGQVSATVLAGDWIGIDREGGEVAVTFSANGALVGKSASAGGTCSFRGNAVPVVNHGYYAMDITFDRVNACLLPGERATGVMIRRGAGTEARLSAGGITATGGQGTALVLTPAPPPAPVPDPTPTPTPTPPAAG